LIENYSKELFGNFKKLRAEFLIPVFLAILASIDLPHQVLEDCFKSIKQEFGGEGYVFMN